MTPRSSSPGTPRRRLLEAPVARKIALNPSRSRSARPKSRPIAVSSRSSTPTARIRAISSWSTSRGSRYSGMPIAIMPPGHGHRLEHGDGVAEAGEVPGRRHAGRPAADDRDPLGAAHRRRLDLGQRAVLGREALQRPDRDRLVQHAAPAGDLARRGADPAAHRRERVDLGRDGVRLVVASRRRSGRRTGPRRCPRGTPPGRARSGSAARRRPSSSRPATAAAASASAT